MKILQITPRVPPAVCGVGDYAWLLAQTLRDEHDIHSTFLSAGITWTKPEDNAEFPVFRLPELTANALVDFIAARPGEFQAIVLQMSLYGYQKRGVPIWLASGLRQVARLQPHPALLTMFHELFASGTMGSSAFWLQPLQKLVLRIVARSSEGLRTNREAYAVWLRQIPGVKNEVAALPVFSNLGEPLLSPPWSQREPAMVMSASGIHSGESLNAVIRRAAACCHRFGLKRLHLIGGPQPLDVADLGIETLWYGFLEAHDFSKLLLSCRMAYTAYNPLYFAKSGLMAAFAAHGLVVITQGKDQRLPDGLQDGVNVLRESSLQTEHEFNTIRLAEIANELRHWYDLHSLRETAASYGNQLKCLQRAEPSAQ